MPILPNVFCCKSNHHDRHDYQRGYLHPKIIGKAAFVFELGIHVDHLPLKRSGASGKKRLTIAPLSCFLGFRHCHPALLAVVGA
jgi:hypothetical protein